MNGGQEIRHDHYLHWVALVAAAAYAWQVHGWSTGLIVLFGTIAIIVATNVLVLALSGSRFLRLNRWAWVILAFVGIALSGASVGTA